MNLVSVNMDRMDNKAKLGRNHDECWFECTELNDWGSNNDYYMWNISMCNSKCDKAFKLTNIEILKIVLARNVYFIK